MQSLLRAEIEDRFPGVRVAEHGTRTHAEVTWDGSLYRVRLGPYGNIEDVNRMRKTMAENGIDVQLIKVR